MRGVWKRQRFMGVIGLLCEFCLVALRQKIYTSVRFDEILERSRWDMWGRFFWLSAAVCGCLFTLSAVAEDDQSQSHSVVIIASPSILPAGARCRVELQPQEITESQTSVTFYEGTIKGITKDKVVLTAACIECRCTNDSSLTSIPYVNRLFKNTGVARAAVEEKEIPIAVENIRSITLLEEATPGDSALSAPRPPESGPPRE